MKVLGLDCGIASVGWAVLDITENNPPQPRSYRIVNCGVYCFNQPIVGGTGKDRFTSIKSSRSRRIGHMHFLRRKRQKLRDIRVQLARVGLLPDSKKSALAEAMTRVSPRGQKPQITPYDLRAKALDHLLSSDEFAVVIGHFAAHPGPRRSSKQRTQNENDEDRGKINSAVNVNAQYAQRGYRTVGEMLARDDQFRNRKHNRQGHNPWEHTVGRTDLLDELRKIFSAQKRLGNTKASNDLRDAVVSIIECKKEPDYDYYPAGPCRFVKNESRASSRSHSFERFRFAENLVKLNLAREGAQKPSAEEIKQAMDTFGTKARTTYADLRELWQLPANVFFVGIKKKLTKKNEEDDFATGKGDSCHGVCTLREVAGKHWPTIENRIHTLDEIARIVTFATREDVVERDIGILDLDKDLRLKIVAALRDGRFDGFVEAAGFSAVAARRLSDPLARGLSYSDACKEVGYDHTAPPVNPVENRNPVVRHAVRQYLETIKAVIDAHGMPDEIRLEMARDVAWGAEKKLEESERNDANRRANQNLRKECKDLIQAEPTSFQVLKYRLAKEQGFKCIYSGADLCESMRKGFEGVDIDHVLPRSEFHIVGNRNNLVACLSGANANKRDQTPFEWSQNDPKFDWKTFTARVVLSKELPKPKRRFLLLKSTEEIKKAFRDRNLVDTQYAVRLLIAELHAHFERVLPPGSKTPPVVGRPGRLVSWLRQGWQLDHIKYEYEMRRNSDGRHHALDAIIAAVIDKRTLDNATRQAKLNERSGRPRDRIRIDPPWSELETDVSLALERIPIVARERKTNFSGLLHKETIYGLSKVNGVLKKRERVAVDQNLTLDHLERFRDSSEKGHIKALLLQWVEDGHPKDRKPTWKYGVNPDGTERRMEIRRITLLTNEGPQLVPARLKERTEPKRSPASYDRAKQMIRVDVFKAGGENPRSPFLYVPVYPHQMNDDAPPSRYYSGNGGPLDWPILGSNDQFLFSLVLLDLIEVVDTNGVTHRLYFRGLDIDSGRLECAPIFSLDKDLRQRFSPTKIRELRKLVVDRLGRISEAPNESRTWRGKVCI
jgi:CRISPR-associated endonuclease Csn1